jgi:cell division protein FtsA
MTSRVDETETIEVPSVGGRPPRVLSRHILSEIIEPRCEEIFAFVAREIRNSGYEELIASGVVITGGTTILEHMPELAEEVLGLPVRRGLPKGVGGLVDVVRNPKFATGVGLVLYGMRNQDQPFMRRDEERGLDKVMSRMKRWFAEIF